MCTCVPVCDYERVSVCHSSLCEHGRRQKAYMKARCNEFNAVCSLRTVIGLPCTAACSLLSRLFYVWFSHSVPEEKRKVFSTVIECGGKVRITLKEEVGQEKGVRQQRRRRCKYHDVSRWRTYFPWMPRKHNLKHRDKPEEKPHAFDFIDIISVFLMSKEIRKFNCFHGKAESRSWVGFRAGLW